MAIPDNLAKAYLQVVGGPKIDCWFNPAEYAITKTNKWTPKAVVGQDFPTPEFGGGDALKLTLDLLFDAVDLPDGDVRGITNELFAAMNVDKALASGKNSGQPRNIQFGWGATTTFTAVCDSLTVTYVMFRPNGIPVRAKAKISLIQAEATGPKGPQNPTTRGTAGLQTHVVRDGDSIQSVAQNAYGDPTLWRRIAEANGIDDPLSLPRGTVLSIPTLLG